MADDCCSDSSGSCYQDRSTNDTDDQRIDTEERPCLGLNWSALLLAYGDYCLFSSLLIRLLSYYLILGGSLVICSANSCFAVRSSWLSSGLLAWRVDIGVFVFAGTPREEQQCGGERVQRAVQQASGAAGSGRESEIRFHVFLKIWK